MSCFIRLSEDAERDESELCAIALSSGGIDAGEVGF